MLINITLKKMKITSERIFKALQQFLAHYHEKLVKKLDCLSEASLSILEFFIGMSCRTVKGLS